MQVDVCMYVDTLSLQLSFKGNLSQVKRLIDKIPTIINNTKNES